MKISATYRIQLHKENGFAAAQALVDYLDSLGISHVYASPYLAAQPGSMHGYDLIDPKSLNPELGTREDYNAWTDQLASRGMGHIVDFVPNHMAASPKNAWWADVLENGPASIYADHFDIEWKPPKEALHQKVLLPVLGAQYGEALEKGELTLVREGGGFCVRYYERCFPVNPTSIAPLLGRALDRLEDLASDDPRRQDLESITSGLVRLTNEEPKDRAREKEVLKRRLAALCEDDTIASALDAEVTRINGTVGEPSSFDDLDRLLVDQNYRLAYWRVATEEINYRRFFEVNDLAAIRMEDDVVFDDMHSLLLELVAEGRVQGVRLDHVDGLYDPPAYFEKLRGALKERMTDEPWIVAEKILTGNEPLPRNWAIDGTTGYEWLAWVNGLLVDPQAEETTTRVYREFTGDLRTFGEQAFDAKRTILRASLASELQMLALRLERLAMQDRRSRDFTLATLRRALGETIAGFPVYRTYVRPDGSRQPTDVQIVTRAIRSARRRNPEVNASVFSFLKDVLLFDGEAKERAGATVAMRFQQLTGPVVAKGVEDTAFYTYVRFSGLNEVGAHPDKFSVTPAAFHQLNRDRLDHWPRAMTTTTTHDTKRGEDIRARLAVLSEMPEKFAAWMNELRDLVSAHVVPIDLDDDAKPDGVAPSPKDQLLFFQTVLGAWPLIGAPDESFSRRLGEYMIKAAREAKQHTSWLAPDETYENALTTFIREVLADEKVRANFASKVNEIATYGASNGLAQVLLKIASPGIPDTYQGSETWDLRLVDPDNRTPVDYPALRKALASLESASIEELIESFHDGRIKLHVLSRALRLRRKLPNVFEAGSYEPLEGTGDEIVGFVRQHPSGTIVCATTRFPYRVTKGRTPWARGAAVWSEPRRPIHVPAGRYRDVLAMTNDESSIVVVDESGATTADVMFRDLPVALWWRTDG